MKLTVQKKEEGIQNETVMVTEVMKTEVFHSNGVPEKVVFTYKNPKIPEGIARDYPPSIDEKSILRRHVQSILGRSLTQDEVENGFDPKVLEGMKVAVVLMWKSGAGGKPQPAIGPVFTISKIKETVAALEG